MVENEVTSYPLFDALLHRRSRRFAKGLYLDGGPLTYRSEQPPAPLTLEEEASLAFAACGITGHALAELPYKSGATPESGGGNIMTHFVARTVASGDAIHCVALFVINDDGVWLLRRPQDFPRSDLPGLIESARSGEFVPLYEKTRVKIADRRLDVPRTLPYIPPFNKWAANLPGTTYFLPVNEMSALYINLLLTALGEECGYFFLDERNRFRPAGLGRFAKSRGGHLDDDPKHGRFGTIGFLETWIAEFAAIEQGGLLQNLGLMTQALGLGGFPHFAAHPFIWFQTLGFRMEQIPFSRTIGAGAIQKSLLGALGKDMPIPTAVGLERNGEPLIKPYCPPYYSSMKEAVLAFVDYKFSDQHGSLRTTDAISGWREGEKIEAAIPRYSDRAIEATIAYCEYVYGRYGRFPSNNGPFRSILAYQAHRLDLQFYERFYRPGALSETQRARA